MRETFSLIYLFGCTHNVMVCENKGRRKKKPGYALLPGMPQDIVTYQNDITHGHEEGEYSYIDSYISAGKVSKGREK